jgi:hypothetical protein
MKRTEFVDDVIFFNYKEDPLVQEEESDDEEPLKLDPESWQDWNSEHLLNMYMSLKEYCEDNGINFMDKVTFNSFCEFIFAR